jgi:hypothetical protein
VTSTVQSVDGVSIRLTSERWMHIVEHHDDLAVSHRFAPRYLVVVYRETSRTDGFVITAFFTTRIQQIERRRLAWKKASS